MVEIIPAIIAKSFDELKSKIKLVESCSKTVQLDVMDGVFVDNKTWDAPEDLEKIDNDILFEAHLMVESPHRILNRWLASAKVSKVILHWEALEKIHNHELLPYKTQIDANFPVSNLSREIHRCGKQFGIALNPKTPIRVLDNSISEIDLVLLMSVDPGFSGQEFKEEVIPKIIALRQRHPGVKIEVDGGVGSQNILKLAETGVDFLVMGSAIFDCSDPQAAIEEIRERINKK